MIVQYFCNACSNLQQNESVKKILSKSGLSRQFRSILRKLLICQIQKLGLSLAQGHYDGLPKRFSKVFRAFFCFTTS